MGFLVRGLLGAATVPWLGAIHLLYGFVVAGASIAVSTEMLALVPPDNKSLSTSVLVTMQRTGAALSGMLSGWLLDIGIFAEEWQLFGRAMTSYDGLLLLGAIMVFLLIITLGLIPSVIGKSQWYPRGPG